jgi:hypothetical protein
MSRIVIVILIYHRDKPIQKVQFSVQLQSSATGCLQCSFNCEIELRRMCDAFGTKGKVIGSCRCKGESRLSGIGKQREDMGVIATGVDKMQTPRNHSLSFDKLHCRSLSIEMI